MYYFIVELATRRQLRNLRQRATFLDEIATRTAGS